jgi:opacity protein-like surface antigen
MKRIAHCALLMVAIASLASAQDVPGSEMSFGAGFVRDDLKVSHYGGQFGISLNITDWLGIGNEIAIYNHHLLSSFLGPKFNIRRVSGNEPWFHLLAGYEGAREAQSDGRAKFKNRFAVAAGGGVDLELNSKLSLRLGADYLHSFRGAVGDHSQIRIQTGIVLKRNRRR